MSDVQPQPIRVGVCGAGGRMGTAACAAIALDPVLELVAAVGRSSAGQLRSGISVSADLRAFADARCDVVVDLTVAAAARTTLPWLAMHGIHAVVGTSGLGDADIEMLRGAFGDGPAHCVIAPNFAISAVLAMRFSEIAARYFDTAEIVELHHDRKVDAPSGMATSTAQRMVAARSDMPWAPDPTEHETVPGARGGLVGSGDPALGGVRVHSVRMRGMVAHQEVILGSIGQTLTIRQDSYDRDSFMPGIVLACKHVADHPGVVVGLDTYLHI
jgi:4-hydroxy-tetrahydrodipicolinate reductase